MELFAGLIGLFWLGMILAVPIALLAFFSQRPCPECTERISKQAKRCPKCTAEIGPYERTPMPSSFWWMLGILAVVAWVAIAG